MSMSPVLVEPSFDPEQVHAIDVAFEMACQTLGLTDIPDQLTDIIAGKIIETAKAGESDPARLYDAVMHWASAA